MKWLESFSKPDMWPVRRFAAISVVVVVIDCVFVLVARKPLPGAAIIPAAIPLLVAVLVVAPMTKKKKA
jgi:hypothetical protein